MKRENFTKGLWITFISLLMVSISGQEASAAQTTFQLDASSIIESGEFNPAEDFLDIAGSMNEWQGGEDWILEPVGDSIYEIEMPEYPNWEYHEFKFRINGNWETAEFPDGGNRGYSFVNNEFKVRFVWSVYGYTLIEGVDFEASQTEFPVGTSIDFTDLSAGDITAWQWTFEGGTPNTSTAQNPTGILYDTPGVFDVTLEVTFAEKDSSYVYTKPDYIDVFSEAQTTTFQLDASPIIESGEFNPAEDFLDIAGSMNGWSGGEDWILSVTEDSTIYEVEVPDQELGTVHEFKFRINADWSTSEFPDLGGNRMYTIKENEDVVRFVWNVYGFTDRSAKDVIFQLDASDIIESGEFDPANDFLDVAGTMNEWSGGDDWILEQVTDSIFEVTLSGNVNDLHEFKFRINGDWEMAEFPDGDNRNYTIKQNENIVMFVWNVYGYDIVEGILFDASDTQVEMGGTLDFTDATIGNAQSWQWYFEGADPASSTDQNPTGIMYNNLGMYNVSLVVDFGRSGSATYTKQEYIEVISEVKDVVFQLDATPILESGEFNPEEDFLDIAGTMNDWSGGEDWILEVTNDTTIYEVLLPEVPVGATHEFKFRINGDWGTAEFPGGDNRSYTVKEEESTVRFVWNVYGYTPIYLTDFEASATDINVGDAVDFTDLSEGEIVGWEWYFEGGEPEVSNDQNPQGIVYNQAGMFDVQLIVTRTLNDTTYPDTVLKEDYITVQAGGAIQEYSLEAGYQFVSTRIMPEDPDMMVVLEDILDDRLDFVRNSAGSMLRKIGPNWVNSIGDWMTVEGYLFRMNDAAGFTIEGPEIDPQTPIDLLEGYQFISYLPPDPMDAMDAFANILNDTLDFVRSSSGDMLRKIGPNWVNNIGDVVPGEGYLVKMNGADELIYPAAATKQVSYPGAEPQYFRFEGGNAADPVYTIYLETGEFIEVGDEVAAFDGDKMVGSTVITSQNIQANNLPVFATLDNGEGYRAGNDIRLALYDASKNEVVILKPEFFNPHGDAHVSGNYPSVDGAYSMVKASGITVENGGVSLYPNPAAGNVLVSADETIQEIRIYDQAGRTIREINIGTSNANIDVSGFDAGLYYMEILINNSRSVEKLMVK